MPMRPFIEFVFFFLKFFLFFCRLPASSFIIQSPLEFSLLPPLSLSRLLHSTSPTFHPTAQTHRHTRIRYVGGLHRVPNIDKSTFNIDQLPTLSLSLSISISMSSFSFSFSVVLHVLTAFEENSPT